MVNKIKTCIKNNKKTVIIAGACVLAAVITIAAVLMTTSTRPKEGELVYNKPSDIEVTAEEMALYRERIGTDMDIKKAILILFETEEECKQFISGHGSDSNPLEAGIGIVPLMENGYYNIVGKSGIEEVFDSLPDGGYSPDPVLYSNLYCYVKRIGIDSPTENDEELKTLIQNEKFQEIRKGD